MRISVAVAAFLAWAAGPAFAGTLADFHAAVEGAAAHNRVAIGYLRTGNSELAALEIDRMREAWSTVGERVGKRPPEFDKVSQRYTTTMLDVSTRLVAASIMINSGRNDAARQSLEAIRDELSDLRKAAGVPVLADCVRDANAAMDGLMIYNDAKLDWKRPGLIPDLAGRASRYRAELVRCDAMAGEPIRSNPEFRRLVDGAQASLTLMTKAIETRDGDLLHRLLIELRSFDNLLAFRYG